ncbi:MAG: hypothetical protein WCL27_14260 [Betaproteobacteria bacterium]
MTAGCGKRGSGMVAWVLGLIMLAWLLLFFDRHRLLERHAAHSSSARAVARANQLTDPALFTEARYTRHPSQADRHAAFQDHPMALEHFPAGSLMPPPR